MDKFNTKFVSQAAPLVVATLLSFSLGACGGAVSEDEANFEPVEIGSASEALSIGPSGHGLDYFRACGENETCPDNGSRYVAYGANGSFLFKSVLGSGGFPCTNAFFGGDPAVGATKACFYTNFAFRVNENQSSTTSDRRAIAYGANGVFNVKTFTGAYNCNNATFGDPIPGPTKACYEALPDYSFAANENGSMTGLNQEGVAYGADGKYVFKVLSGTQGCNNAVFGDPAVGASKTCYRTRASTIATEGGTIPQNTSVVLYGSGLNGFYLASTGFLAHGSCTNTAFHGDPDQGPTKRCFLVH